MVLSYFNGNHGLDLLGSYDFLQKQEMALRHTAVIRPPQP
jgi:hypothetical protein